jgi:peptidoglycan/xylan/chitin deacetylase (PgdA/CDA1 family)
MIFFGFESRHDKFEGPVVTLAFDDGWLSEYENAFPLMQERGMVGTFYIVSDLVGCTGRMTADQLRQLQNAGNEIGSHSKTHPDFTTLTEKQIRQECISSKEALEALGLHVNNFRYPSANSNSEIDRIVGEYYESGCYGTGEMGLPITSFKITTRGAWNDSLETVKRYIDDLVDHGPNNWIIISFHRIEGVTGGAYFSIADFTAFLDYLVVKGVSTVTVQQVLDYSRELVHQNLNYGIISNFGVMFCDNKEGNAIEGYR